MTASIQRRSNRPLTKFACDHLDSFLKGKVEMLFVRNENTSVEARIWPNGVSTFAAFLYDTEILTVILEYGEPTSVIVGIGNSFTPEGYPKKTTIERLNGLLDELGGHGILPEGVRIFKDRIENLFYLGKGDNKIAVGKGLALIVRLEPDPEDFLIESSDLTFID